MEGRMVEHNNSKNPKAQVTLELAFAIMAIVILLTGAIKLFIWLNQRFILRQNAYEETRVSAGNTVEGNKKDLTAKPDLPALDFFGEKEKK